VRKELTPAWRLALAAVLVIAGTCLWAQDRADYLNGVAYLFPLSQGAAARMLTNDGVGNLTWSPAGSSSGLWTNSVVLSTVACPTGWTRVSAADARVLRANTAAGGTGGADTHSHTVGGVSAAATVALSGSPSSVGIGLSGSTDIASVSHSHTVTTPRSNVTAGGTTFWTGFNVDNSDPSHSHGVGSLSGSSHGHSVGALAFDPHGHGPGSLALDSASNLAAYYNLVVCVMN
jgi:hypothetical protein